MVQDCFFKNGSHPENFVKFCESPTVFSFPTLAKDF